MRFLKSISVFVFVVTLSVQVLCDTSVLGSSTTSGQALVISTTTPGPTSESSTTDASNDISSTSGSKPEVQSPEAITNGQESSKPSGITLKPEIYSFHIDSDIRYRYSRTYVTSRVVNPSDQSQEVNFRVILPETGFISKFVMEIDGKSYEAYVKEKQEAKKVYALAQSQGQSAGLVELNTRNANVFDVNVNIKAQAKVNFNLTYEELLSRRLGRYEQSISISPDQITNVKDFQISVNIEESQNITLLRVPNLRNDIESQEDSEGNNKDAIIERPAGNKAQIKWRPSDKDQSQLAKQGITGKFVVQYDIKRELDAGEILVMNGYFVHFFAPANLAALRKHVVFVLDTSGSMWGRKMAQLKEAMQKILADLNAEDYFNILTFDNDVTPWSPDSKSPSSANSNWAPPPFHGEPIKTAVTDNAKNKQPFSATPENIAKAQKYIESLIASGGTNIQEAIVHALNLTAAIKSARDGETKQATATTIPVLEISTTEASTTTTTIVPDNSTTTTVAPNNSTNATILPQYVESLILFLTDGEPTVGVTDLTQIQTAIQAANKNISVPLFSLAFGEGADFPFVRKLSLQNNGFARKIYEASDAAIQLKGFYNEIASPLLSNVTFNYTSPEYSIQNLTLTKFPTVFGGTEIAVAGIIVPNDEQTTTTESATEATTISPSEFLEEVQVEGNQVAPTEKRYFDVVVGGFGRDGHVHFNNPEIFSSPIPWGIPVTKPFPPRPTPVPTQEDLFLERLWAYLTVQQLIEKDLAKQDEENVVSDEIRPTPVTTTPTPASTVVSTIVVGNKTITVNTILTPESPRKKALRLSLKYGFVTSLTSLVVVKPNGTDAVTDAVAANPSPAADSLAAPQSFSHYQMIKPVHNVKFSVGRPAFTTNRISIQPLVFLAPGAGFVPGNAGGGFGGFHAHTQAASPGSFGPYPSFAGTQPPAKEAPYYTTAYYPSTTRSTTQYSTSTTPSFESEMAEEDTAIDASTPTPDFEPESVTTTSEPEQVPVTVHPVSLTLDDLTWFNETILVKVNGSELVHTIATNATNDDTEGSECGDAKTGHKGHCAHLKDCLIPAIVDDYKLYVDSYFCSIESRSSGALYAGTCCATQPKKSKPEP